MLQSEFNDRIQIIWDIKNIDEPTKSSIIEYIDHGFGKIDRYLESVLLKVDDVIILKVKIEKKWKWNFVWSLHFDFPGWDVKDISVKIDENTPEESLPAIISELFDKAKSSLSRQIDKARDKRLLQDPQ